MTRTETIVYGDFEAPVGTVVSSITLTITDSAGVAVSQSVVPGERPVPVELNAETYIASAQAVDASGQAVGPAATDSFVISVPTSVTVSIPVAMSGV
jgi:hypothetical protein